ncbi:MAG TPA: sigma-70 family RNA polymerase sigma factor [Longimicrobiales bacterium]|nr:sigma-70 family RNA polymerase sigma factor [Longimicrobiales bacterium]
MDRMESFQQEALPHLDAVYRFALRLSGSPADAEDLVQETFLRAYRAWEQYTPGTRAKSWLFTICRNVFLRQRKRDRRRDETVRQAANEVDTSGVQTGEIPVFTTAYQYDPEGQFFASIIDDGILLAIEGLPADFRDAVVLSDLEGLSYAEIADVLGIPIGTVKSRLFRGRRLLQRQLYEYATESGYVQVNPQ